MNTTHLALIEPGGETVNAGGPSPLDRRRTNTFFVREGDRERTYDDLKGQELEVARTGGTFRELAGAGTEETFNRERKVEREEGNPGDSEK